MKYFLFVLALTLSCFTLTAQENFIPNGSFEEYSSCPISNELNNGPGEFEKVKGWWKPTSGTSDYYNSCNSGIVSVPQNLWGYQEAYHGKGYIGIGIDFYKNSGQVAATEYAMAKLTSPLRACHKYRLTFRMSLANLSTYSFSQFGALLVKDSFHVNSSDQLFIDGLKLINDEPISDTSAWKEISFDFESENGEEYICLGYFADPPLSDSVFFQSSSAFPGIGYGYYFIDDVSLIEVGTSDECFGMIPNVITPNEDGVNDIINLSGYLGTNFEMKIVNRWGESIATLSEVDYTWKPGDELTDGVYFYILTFEKDGFINSKTGFIHLLRS